MEVVSDWAAHGGRQLVTRHPPVAMGGETTFSTFLPPPAATGSCSVL